MASARTPGPAPQRRRRSLRLLLQGVVAVAVLASAWTLAVGWWLPRFLVPRIEAQASVALGAPLSIGRLEIAPWTLQARAGDVRLGPPQQPWVQVEELHADVSAESVWRLAPVLQRFTVRSPRIELERQTPDRYNITPMIEALARRPAAPPDSEPARFAIHNIRVEDGLVHLVDRVGGSEHRISELRLGIPFLSSLPSHVRIDVEPLLEAKVNGSPLHLRARTLPFTEERRSSIDLQWQRIDMGQLYAAAAPLLPRDLPAALRQGWLDLDLQVAFERRDAPAPPLLQVGGRATLSDARLTVPAQEVEVAWQALKLEGLDVRPFERRVRVQTVALQAPAAEIDLAPRDAHAAAGRTKADSASRGTVLPAAASPAASAASPAASAASAGAPGGTANGAPRDAPGTWHWRVEHIALTDGALRLRAPGWPEGQRLAPVEATVTGLDARDARPATFTLAFADAHGAKGKAEGTVAIKPYRIEAVADLAGVKLAPWIVPWQAAMPARLLDASATVRAGLQADADGWSLRDGTLQLEGLQVEPVQQERRSARPAKTERRGAQPADRLAVAKAVAAGVQVQATGGAPPAAVIDTLSIEGLDLRALRTANGTMAWVPPATPRASASGRRERDAAASPAPAWKLGELRCRGCAVALVDRGVEPPATLALRRTDLTLRRLGSDLRQPVEFDLSTGVSGGGRAKASGTLRVQPLALRTRVNLAAVDLGQLQAYIEPYLNVTLAAAKASVAGDLRVDGDPRGTVTAAHWRGRLELNDLRTLDQLNSAEFVRLRRMSLDGADVAWREAALEADLGEVELDDFFGRVIIDSSGRINLRDIVKTSNAVDPAGSSTAPAARQEAARSPPVAATVPAEPDAPAPAAAAAASAPGPGASAAPEPGATSADPPLRLRWRVIRVSRGEVDFTDNFIQPNYSARLTGVVGEVSALAWNEPQPAQIRLTGQVDQSAPLEIAGTIHPLGARLHTDITANARGIDLTRLSTYAARYAGYGIEKGTLSARVHYRVNDGRLEAENNLYLDQLTFGQKVESPDALKLPVLLAVSLLKDRNGVIDINLPVRGSLDDPQFSIGGVIVRVIVNLIARAVTAPFTLLAQAFGGGKQELRYLPFQPGSADIDGTMTATLDTLTKALSDRPGLRLEITGHADGTQDEPALRRAYVEGLLRQAKARSMREPADKVVVEPGERERWLEAAYRSADLPDKPRNVIGLQKTLPAAEMEAALLKGAPIGQEDLKKLADRRADRVKAWLSEKLPPERLLLTASRLDAANSEDGGQKTRVSFNVK